MPIYEFKCLRCDHFFEILVMGAEDQVTMECPRCHASDFERVISVTRHNMAAPSSGNAGAHATTRTCASGSCTTYTIPGPNG